MAGAVARATLRSMTTFPPPAEELRLLDAELRQLDARRGQLLARRAQLVAALYAVAPRPLAGPAPSAPPRPEASAPRVQNVLLVLGGVLLTVAAAAFTLLSWGDLGIAGRATVLGAVTAAVLAAPLFLLRRGLRSTAESVAGLGLALTVLDAYALHEAALGGTDGTAYAAVSAAVLATLWTGYGAVSADLRLPRPAALTAAQFPLLLGALAVDAEAYGISAVLLVTAAADAVVAVRERSGSAVSFGAPRIVAVAGAGLLGGGGALIALRLSWTADGPGAAAGAAALLGFASMVAVGAAHRTARGSERLKGAAGAPSSAGAVPPGTVPPRAVPPGMSGPSPAFRVAAGTALSGGLLLVVALGGLLRVSLPGGWAVPAHLVCAVALAGGAALTGVARVWLPEAVRRGLVGAGAAVQALSLLWALPLVLVVVTGPLGWAQRPWSGGPGDAREAVTVLTPWPPYAPQALVVLVVLAGVAALSARRAGERSWASTGAVVLGWTAVLGLPAVLALPYPAGLALLGAATAALLALEGRLPHPRAGTVLALITSVDLAFLALADRTATLAVLSALAVLCAVASGSVRRSPLTAPAAVVYATALACATGAAAGWSAPHTALLVLAVPAACAPLAARAGAVTGLGVESAGAAAGAVAVGLAVTDAPVLALVLSLLGVVAAGTAARPDRRQAGYAAAVLFLLASWVRLAAWDVGTPEAYTLPVTVPALLVGVRRRRREPRLGSWPAYGPGLAVTLVPSLGAAWTDAGWTRPLLLGSAALAVTLLGARHRLRAPLVLGGAVLVLDALHELAPYLVQVADGLPRWVPPALAGLLLLAAGATYEQRIRDVRRVREALGRMN